MSKTSKADGNRNRATILALVLSAGIEPGIGTADLMLATGLTDDTIGVHIRALEAAGLVERSQRLGSGVVFGPVGTAAHHAKKREAVYRAARLRRQRARRLKMSKAADVPETDAPDWEPVRRWGSAADAPRVGGVLLRSVWSLGDLA